MTRFFTFCQRHGGTLLALRGEIDLLVRDELRGILDEAVTSDAGDIEVDLRAVTFLDCAAIGAIVAARNAAHRAGRALFVSHPTQIVRQVLALTGTGDLERGEGGALRRCAYAR